MFTDRFLRGSFVVVLALLLTACGKSSTKPQPPQELPNDPNAGAPALGYANHFSADTQWVEVTPTTDDVEVRNIRLYLQYAPGGGWMQMYPRLVGASELQRNTTRVIEVTNPWKGHDVYAATLSLDIRRTPYRTWFHLQVY